MTVLLPGRASADRVAARAGRAAWWPRLRVIGGAAVLAVLVWQLGTGPFLTGLRSLDLAAVLVALAAGAVTTVCSAWRWRVVAQRLGVGLPLRSAVAAYYGSQFLNATLPGGVLGDVHRALRHGRAVGEPGRGARSVVWERVAGPVVHLAVTLVVVLALPSPLSAGWAGAAAGAAGLLTIGLGLALWLGRSGRRIGAVVADLRHTLLARSAWPQVLVASLVVALGHAAIFVFAARITGADRPATELLPVAMLVLAAMLVPLNVGGWGPREGVAAALFAAAGWGAGQGVAAATAFGLLALIATLPGLVVLIARFRRPAPVGAGSAAAAAAGGAGAGAGPEVGAGAASVPRAGAGAEVADG